VSFGAQTDQVYNPTDGVSARGGEVDVLNALIVSGSPGTGRLIAGLSNEDPSRSDAITGVRGVGDDQGVTFSLAGGSTRIPSGGLLQLADPSAANVTVSGDPSKVMAGGFVRLTFSFKNAQEATLDVPVLDPDETYKDVQLPSGGNSSSSGTPSPTESPIPSQTAGSSTSSNGGTSSGVPSPSASPSPSKS
jgi:hypothetical protein